MWHARCDVAEYPSDVSPLMPKQIHLALDVSWTQVETAWRAPGSWVGRHYPDIGLFEDIARIAERGLFDMIFFGDGAGIPNTWEGGIDAAVRRGVAWPRLDMSPWITAMSRVTSHVGFGLTYASTFMHPFYVARLLNSLDHITNGRIAFNVISSQRRSDYENYGFDELIEHGERYDRMEEFIAVCKALWSSVDADAFVWDRLNGLVADPAKVRPINHVGRFFKVKGPLSVVPSPQGHPVLIQAGGSPRGIWAASGFVDHVFGAGKGVRLMAQQRQDMDKALRERGRDPEEVGIVAANASPVGFVGLLIDQYGQDGEITRDEFMRYGLEAATGYGITRTGTAAQIADYLEETFEATGSRGGFMLTHSQCGPRDLLHNIVDLLVPELQRRGRFRTAYAGRTLRENLAA